MGLPPFETCQEHGGQLSGKACRPFLTCQGSGYKAGQRQQQIVFLSAVTLQIPARYVRTSLDLLPELLEIPVFGRHELGGNEYMFVAIGSPFWLFS